MIEPVRAAVRPRVRLQPSGEVVSLEDVVAELLAAGRGQRILLCGELGAGTTESLRHLAHEFQDENDLRLQHCDSSYESPTKDPDAWVWIHPGKPESRAFLHYQLVGWGRDEWIEYLLAVHHDRCASVMRRLQVDDECDDLEGNPALWRHVLNELAANEDLKSVRAALQRIILKMFPDPDVRRFVGWEAFQSLAPTAQPRSEPVNLVASAASLGHEEYRLMKRSVLMLLAADAVACELDEGDFLGTLQRHWPQRLIDEVALHVAKSLPIQDRLRLLIEPNHCGLHPLVASLLHASGIGWKPETSRLFGLQTGWLNLKEAWLPNADWPGIDLSDCGLEAAVFSNANLAEAKLSRTIAWRAIFNDANLTRAKMSRFDGYTASFVGANMTSVCGRKVTLERANLSFADLTEAQLTQSNLKSANFSEAILRRACLKESDLNNSVIDGADFSGADFELADLSGLDLTAACFAEARFVNANLHGCNLEGMELPAVNFSKADLSKAYLTGSAMPNANFSGADLREAGLAEIDWEFADLRDADLSNVSFHMGSTRSGLVGSNIPMLGSRTGFYTDDYNEQDFKSPEEIRKANLRGADMRGAIIDHTDFYLVDLRDALYDSQQEKHFRRCGAILETRGE